MEAFQRRNLRIRLSIDGGSDSGGGEASLADLLQCTEIFEQTKTGYAIQHGKGGAGQSKKQDAEHSVEQRLGQRQGVKISDVLRMLEVLSTLLNLW